MIIVNIYDIWFSNINITNKEKIELLKKFKVEELWNFTEKDFSNILEDSKILNSKNGKKLEKYLYYMEKNDIDLISITNEKYPKKLKYIKNKPAYIYVRGNVENLYGDNVAIVGSRNASEYGKYVSRKIAKELADRNINIVSGLAIGIDKYAHLGALESEIGKTIAVLGTGISNEEIYPLQNKRIFERILSNNGTIISEFNLGTKPEKFNFPLRNRIISGLSEKLIVVEATEKSGSLITANYALEQGKDVYAVPGNITSINSVGTNKLIEEGAYIFKSINDIFIT